MGQKSILFYLDWRQHFDMLTMEDRGKMLTAIYDYSESGKVPDFPDSGMRMMFSFVKSAIDRDVVKYEEKCEQNRINALKRLEKIKELEKLAQLQSQATVSD